jgi:hypothetical protein
MDSKKQENIDITLRNRTDLKTLYHSTIFGFFAVSPFTSFATTLLSWCQYLCPPTVTSQKYLNMDYTHLRDMKEAAIYRPNVFKEPLTNFLFSKRRNYFAILLFIFSLQIIASLDSGTFVEIDVSMLPQEKADLLKDDVKFISTINDLPLFFAYIIAISLFFLARRFFPYIPQACETLFSNEIFKEKKGSTQENVLVDYNRSLQEFENMINSKYMYIPAFLLYSVEVGFFVIYWKPIEDLDIIFWNDFNFSPLSWILLIIAAPLMWFVVGILIWKMYCVVAFMRKLTHQYEFDLNPYNPDGFGGFKPLGQIWANMALVAIPVILYYIAIFLFHLVQHSLEFPYSLLQGCFDIAVLISYTIGIVVFLVYPMKEYHDVVKAQKLELLTPIGTKISGLWKIVKNPLLSGENEDSVRASLRQLERSQQFVCAIKEISSWPFTPSERIGIFLIALVPWILEIVNYLRQPVP